MIHVNMYRLAYSSAHVTIFLTDDANVCYNSRARTTNNKKKQYFSIVHISVIILQMFLCSWTLCELCADITSSSIFSADPCLLKTNWIWCANYRKSHKQNIFYIHIILLAILSGSFQILYIDFARFMYTKNRECHT